MHPARTTHGWRPAAASKDTHAACIYGRTDRTHALTSDQHAGPYAVVVKRCTDECMDDGPCKLRDDDRMTTRCVRAHIIVNEKNSRHPDLAGGSSLSGPYPSSSSFNPVTITTGASDDPLACWPGLDRYIRHSTTRDSTSNQTPKGSANESARQKVVKKNVLPSLPPLARC